MTKQELFKELKQHDWFHMYSDDFSVSHAGYIEAKRLQQELDNLNCPFGWWNIHKAIQDYAVEKYVEVKPGEYRDPTWEYKCIASQRREDLLTRQEIQDILEWFNER